MPTLMPRQQGLNTQGRMVPKEKSRFSHQKRGKGGWAAGSQKQQLPPTIHDS